MLRNPFFRSALAAAALLVSLTGAASLSGCAARQPIETQAALGKVVVYRNGVAYFERRAIVTDGQLKLTVPTDRVDDFLKSLKVIDANTRESLPVSFDTMQPSSNQAEMIVSVPGNQSRELLVSYVTDSPAWKPSYRIVLDAKKDTAELEAWAVVDNVSGEDWRRVTIGVGSTSALSFRYDLHSVRMVEREALGDEVAFAAAGPMGGSPYAIATAEAPVMAALDMGMLDRLMGDGARSAAPSVATVEESAEDGVPMGLMAQGYGGGGNGSGRGAGATHQKPKRESKTAMRPATAEPAKDFSALDRLAQQIQHSAGKIQLQGFARRSDADPHSAALARAESIRDQLVQRGVPLEKIDASASGIVNETQAVRVVTQSAEGAPQQSGGADERNAAIGNAYFLSKVPMTIEKDRSAMVSLLKSQAKAERVYYYDPISPRGSKTFAFQAVRIDNPSDQTLDRGPFTVYSAGQFLGEGLSDAIPPRSTAFVPYALDRQLIVDSKNTASEEIHRLLTIDRGIVQAEVHQVLKTTFSLHNRSDKASRVYVRYAVSPGWELRAGDRSVERLGNDYLIPIEVPAHKDVEVSVGQAQPAERSIDMRAPEGATSVEAYLKRTTTLPADLRAQLEGVLKLYKDMADIEERRATLAEQMAEYRTRIDEINFQLVTLRKVKTAGALSQHLTKKMREISDRLQKATIRTTDLQEELMTCRIRMQDELSDLKLARAEEGASGSAGAVASK